MTCQGNLIVMVAINRNCSVRKELHAFVQRVGFFVLILAGSNLLAQKEPWTELSKGVYFGTYPNWPKSVFMFSPEAETQAVVIPNFGGRIVHYSWRGKNVLLDVPDIGEKGNFHLGGHQADIGPEVRELPPHPTLSMGKTSWQHKPFTVRILGDPDPVLGVAVEKDILLDRETGDLALTQRMVNSSKTNVSYSVWSRTACRPGGYALLPLNKKSKFKNGWTVHNVYNGSFVFDGEKYVSLHVREMDDILVIYCDSEPTKLGTDSTAEWMAYVYEDLLFIKYTRHIADGNYSDGGNTTELYFDRDVAELQALSPEVELAPGENYSFPEKWSLVRLPEPVYSFDDARKMVKKIPSAPFPK